MVGSVWAWTQDCYRDTYQGAPADGSAWTSSECFERVLRGGVSDYNPQFLRSTSRFKNIESIRGNFIGFRVARTLVLPW